MIAELGHFTLILALFAAVAQALLTGLGMRARDPVFFAYARAGAFVQFALVLAAFACLTWLFAVSDFSALVVAENSHSDKPFIYKLTGVWGNHEGSMLLWVLILTAYTAWLAASVKQVAPKLISLTFAVQSVVTSAFIAFLLFTSNPFARLWPAPMDGQGLNPLLQDPGLASHPPFLYAGYVGFSITFSFAVAALIEGRVDARWARIVRPWALAAWSLLTIGILLGASWAYYELGWGGWWAWDPVENASLMPWLAGTAFIHSLRVMEKRDTLKSWTLLLAILTFSLSLAGTFLVRSGIITSVHSFAVDPARGVFILLILVAVIGGALALYGLRTHLLKPTGLFSLISRESTLVINNLFIVAACLLVFFGTFYPLFVTTVSDRTISIGAPFYNATFNPMMGVLLVLIPVSSMLAWKRAKLGPLMKKLIPAAAASAIAALVIVWFIGNTAVPGILGTALAVWVGLGVLIDLAQRIKLFDADLSISIRRAANLPLSLWGMTVSHLGVAILVMAITGVSVWKTETRAYLVPGGVISAGDYAVTLDDVSRTDGANYVAEQGVFTVVLRGVEQGELVAERRFYPVRQMSTTESAIRSGVFGDVYVTIGEPVADRGWPVHVYIYPLAWWLWIGGTILALGGALAIADQGRRSLGRTRSKSAREG